jgi:hypothetical protein
VKATLIKPESKTIEAVTLNPETLLSDIRQALGLVNMTEGVIPHIVGPGVILWLHDRGLIMPEPSLWKLEDNVFAGPAVIHGMHPFSAQFTDGPTQEDVASRVNFTPGIQLKGISERLRVVQGQQGFVPLVDRSPEFEPIPEAPQEPKEPPEADPEPVQLWTVYKVNDGFRGIKYEISSNGHRVVDDPVEADSLDTLYVLMEVDEDEGDTCHPRDARDAPSIVETWRIGKR